MNLARIFFGFVLLLASVLSSITMGQPVGTRRDSLQWMAARADAIVRGPVTSVAALNPGDKYSKVFQVNIVAPIRIAGQPGKNVCFVVTDQKPYVEKSGPMRLVATPPYNISPMLRYAARSTDTKAIIACDDGHPQIFSARLEWTSDPNEMLAIVRKYLEQVPGARESRSRNSVSLSFEPPKAFLENAKRTVGRYERIKFPIDSYLEQHARRWIKSERNEDRWLGAYALVYFKSDENAEALKGLLYDPGHGESHSTCQVFLN